MKKLIYLFLLTVFCTVRVMAQGTFVYTNNDRTPNNVSAFSAAANGALSPFAGSPFATGGNGACGGSFAPNRITAAIVKNFLFAGNSGSNNVSGFSINPATGVLTSVPGSPFATGGVAGAVNGMSLTATPDDKFLIAASGMSMTISVFSIAANGALRPVPGSPTPDLGATGVDCNCASKQLFVALNSAANSRVDVFDIG